ncbi:hypothetical protein SAMD00023353_12800040 [Rosellinia necatrix]|uniref:Uncharacterized protein n=1 Tax=Rosellinia necatrix TaxID=77044 RepID=A0A1W2TT36_ROSNE|nr:hypothetical protein SAMD00023353_12800040 [Rosellinia necatrix]
MIPFTVSLNGPDNIGKTTQLSLLSDNFTVSKVGGLHEHDEMIHQLQLEGRWGDWWWNSSVEEFICTVIRAAVHRYQSSVASASRSGIDLVIFDRGVAMFKAVVVAMTAIKRGDDNLDTARQIVNEILQKNGLAIPHEELAIILMHNSGDIGQCVEWTMNRQEDPNDKEYAHYQRLLQTELLNQEAQMTYQYTIWVSQTDSYDKLQGIVRKIIFEETKNLFFQPMLHPVQIVIGFSGLSESGKSTMAKALCDSLGPHQAFRAKLVYFNNIASQRLSRSIYSLSEKEQALHILHGLESFARSHYWLRVLTIESLHGIGVTRLLKSWLGDRFQVVYIDVDDTKRLSRSLVTPSKLHENDQVKREKGVETIAAEADLVLGNNGSFESSFQSLIRFARSKGDLNKKE